MEIDQDTFDKYQVVTAFGHITIPYLVHLNMENDLQVGVPVQWCSGFIYDLAAGENTGKQLNRTIGRTVS